MHQWSVIFSCYSYNIIAFARPPKTFLTWCNAQQAILALKAYFSIGEEHPGDFVWKEKEINKLGNLEQSGHTKINGFLTNTEQLIIIEQRVPSDVINASEGHGD